MGANDDIRDALTMAQLDAIRVERTTQRTVRGLLDSLHSEVRAQLVSANLTDPSRLSAQQQRLLRFRDEFLRPRLTDGYGEIAGTVEATMEELARATVQATRAAVNEQIGITIFRQGVPDAVLRALVDNTLLPVGEQHAAGRAWWQRFAQRHEDRVFDTLNRGLVLGEDVPTLTERLRGTKTLRYQNGTEAFDRNAADSLVRTYANGALNEGRTATYDANADVIEAIQHSSTLDGRTTLICIGRSGGQYTVPGHEPIAPTTVAFLTGPPYHFRCRSTMIPVLRSFQALFGSAGERFDRRLQTLPPATRASLDGQVPADTTFDAFLRRHPDQARRQLGATRYQLWQDGKLSLPNLLDAMTGDPLSVEALMARSA